MVEAVLELLHEGGATRQQAAWGADVLLQLATATAAEQSARNLAPDARHEEERLTAALRSATAGQYPRIAAVGGELLSGPGRSASTGRSPRPSTGLSAPGVRGRAPDGLAAARRGR
jgi:hypothetical protein